MRAAGHPHPILRRYALLRPDRSSAALVLDDDRGGLEIARTVCGGKDECGGGGSLALTTPITTG